ncbi:nuclear transport factor 2 family protein [Flagellimonas nanhaiensis]|uniref:Nuclear transport factor 2 family protein n=1 Tax=Flagellimonas nanhaiensis TaxID=2292706 RepID=A0A371JT88_9FLAO|nr:nuclear transport factor 2 family protein [Allomuricauda nanhaiensis]RDY61040.1 hypothetical protein DX873_02375 [Allomuricauda nanhaiensis]
MNTKNGIALFVSLIFAIAMFSQTSEKEEIQEVIEQSYIKGLIDAGDFDEARKGIHENFIIWGHRDTTLTSKTRDEWIAQRKKRPDLAKVDYSIVFIDISDEAASAKVEMSRGNIWAVDYIFLYKFKNTWRIVSAIDHVKRLD